MMAYFDADGLSEDRLMLLKRMAHCVRFLSADMVQKANSGHPGVAMGLADVMSVLSGHLHLCPDAPFWLDRDRLIFSGGHASAMIYALMHLWGFDVSLDDLKSFRQLGSKCAGHPECGLIPGIEISTGPLGQGVANAVGFAMAREYAAKLLNEKDHEIITHRIYCLCGDGDLEEGISYEACSLAGHLGLSSLTLIYDCNKITIEGSTDIAFSEDVRARFLAAQWDVVCCDGHDMMDIDRAIRAAKASLKPCLIIAHTTIAQGSKNLCGSHKSHGAPLGEEEIAVSKEMSGFCSACDHFYIPDDVREGFALMMREGSQKEKRWHEAFRKMSAEKSALLKALESPDFDRIVYPSFEGVTTLATRSSNGKILQAIAKALPGFLGGSADLAPSNNTTLDGELDFPLGRNVHFGIREHSMGAICNAFSRYGLFLPYCATFFVFSDYMSPSVRLAALMKNRCYYIWTHDSIGVGEDGATHQPIEQLTHFRAMPDLYVFRPCDAYENIAAWKAAFKLDAPCAFVLSRQNLPIVNHHIKDISQGGYIIKDTDAVRVVLMASGSEVHVCLQVAELLEKQGIGVRVVSVPCYDLLCKQDANFIESLVPQGVLSVAVEAASGLEWYRFVDRVIGMKSFGESAPGNILFKHFGFDAAKICDQVVGWLKS